jgi:hypothetical protein
MQANQHIMICLVDDEHARCFDQPSDVQEITTGNLGAIMNGSLSSDDRMTLRNAECIHVSIDQGTVMFRMDGAYYAGSIYCYYADEI